MCYWKQFIRGCEMCSSVPPTDCIRPHCMMCSSVPPTDCIRPHCMMCSSVPPTDCIRPLYDVFQCSTYRLYQTTVWCVPPTDYQTTLYDVFHLLTVSDQTVWCVPVFHLQTIRPHCMMCSSVPPTNCIRSNWMMCSSVPPTDYQTTLYDVFQCSTYRLSDHTVWCVPATYSMIPIKYKHSFGASDSKSHPLSWYNTKLSWRQFAEQNCVLLEETACFLFIDKHSTSHPRKA